MTNKQGLCLRINFDGNMVFVNVMKNMSIDCDCCAVAEDPGREHLVERIESRNGVHTIEAAAELGFWF